MPVLRTELERTLGERFPLDMTDLDAGDYEALDDRDAADEAERMARALEAGEALYLKAVRSACPRFGGGA